MVGEQPQRAEDRDRSPPLEGQNLERDASQRRLLHRLLTHRFGPLDAVTAARLEAATGAELELYSDRVFGASSLEDVLAQV